VEDAERRVLYFGFCGEANTEKLLQAVRRRCGETPIGRVVVASETGRSALRALELLIGVGVRLVVVTHYPATTWGPRGKIPIGLRREEYSDALRELEEGGARIVQGSRPFAPPTRSIGWDFPTPKGVVDRTLEVFGAGTKIAIEAAIMATDAGEVEGGEVIVVCAGTFKGLDTALDVKAAGSMSFFKEFEVREVVARPMCRVRRLPEYEFENWKGDLYKYYHEPS
jgi:hypothetical protein